MCDTKYDLTETDFNDFITFIFDHTPVAVGFDDSAQEEPWYWSVEVRYEPETIIRYYTKLFSNPHFLIYKFTEAELEQGFWAIQSDILDCSVTAQIFNSDLPRQLRIQCIQSMYTLYQKLFAIKPLYTSSNMWWDSIAYDWHCGNLSRSNGGEELWLQDAIFDTLKQIITISSPVCQYAALHGLGHLHHPETSKLISNFLQINSHISQEMREYARAAEEFSVL